MIKTASITVVVPCFRCKGTVERAVKSISSQTLLPELVVLVDDFSDDGTLDELKRLQAIYGPKWISVIGLSTNKGAGSARNAGWNIARSKYIAFLDSDDSWHPSKLELQYSWMLEHPDVSISGHPCTVVPKDFIESSDLELDPIQAKPYEYPNCLFSNRLLTPSVMLLRDIPFRFLTKKRYSEDYHLWLSMILEGHKAVILQKNLAYLHKPEFGSSGLSGNLLRLEIGELETFLSLYKDAKLSARLLALALVFSVSKFVRRCVLVFARRISGMP